MVIRSTSRPASRFSGTERTRERKGTAAITAAAARAAKSSRRRRTWTFGAKAETLADASWAAVLEEVLPLVCRFCRFLPRTTREGCYREAEAAPAGRIDPQRKERAAPERERAFGPSWG